MRVTSEGAIVVDDKFVQNVPDVMSRVKSITAQPIRYLLNSHHHANHIGGNGAVMDLGIGIIAHRNVRENIIRNRQPGPPRLAARLELDDIGWAHTVSTATFMRSIVRYRDEVAASRP